ncbi:hypothetical protein [Clostridium taeniosporum]|uniref:Uncharacterized protein n=1 Tax=Clostridium taeniosporum TaxID=394958 RepID=A0A1D7XIH9_9CLOT|nr:hypothetical protein [Clostridium taeniosporum]AOR23147.1 hypothetical protein BGI42_05145 [Clostridium taeniosporum]
MYYKKIYEFIEGLNKDNIEELKPQLSKYVGELILSIKDEENNLSLEDIDGMMSIALMREEIQYGVEEELKEENSKFGLLTDEFMNSYREFTNEMAEREYVQDAINLTRSVLKALGCIHREIFLVDKLKGSSIEKHQYMISTKYLEDLQKQLHEHLNQYTKEISREYLLILGLVNYIKNELKENIDEIGRIILSELKNKSLEDFNKEEHIHEYKSMINKDYIKELQKREYLWNILSSKLQEVYYRDELYEDLE